MKRINCLLLRVIIILLIFISSKESVFSESKFIPLGKVEAKVYNDFLNRFIKVEFESLYKKDTKIFDFFIEYSVSTFSFEMNKRQIENFKNSIRKFNEWNKKATAKGVQLDKKIFELPVVGTSWKYGEWQTGKNTKIRSRFFSQTNKRHQFLLEFPAVYSKYNEYITYSPETVYFSYSEINKILNTLSDESVSRHLEAAKKQKAIEDEFK